MVNLQESMGPGKLTTLDLQSDTYLAALGIGPFCFFHKIYCGAVCVEKK